MLVITPERKEAIPLAITRIKANLIAGIASLACLLISSPTMLTIMIAITITIICCYFLNLMTGSRSAIAAVIIIMMHGIENTQPFFWASTIERVGSVVIGCFIGLIITLAFHLNFGSKVHTDSNEG
jgi:uncharacterized membrane protein YgaE (UPF0421/DUF939 family)